jgi:hypothetical protein
MNTDFERYQQLFTDTGVPYKLEPAYNKPDCMCIYIEAGGSNAILDGYTGFYAEFTFNKEGVLQRLHLAE